MGNTISFQTEEQRENTFDAAGVIDSSFLGSPKETDFKTSDETGITFPISDLDTETSDFKPTEPEKKADILSKEIEESRKKLAGESELRTELEEEAGIPELQKTQSDLAARLKAIQNESKAIPLQLQEEAKGRGITKAGLAPLQTARLRTNAIQALGVSSLLEASKGNLTTALDLVDRAVSQKYDPIREEIKIKKDNLDLIIDSPEFDRADKARAAKQKREQEKIEKDLDAQEDSEKAIRVIAVDAAKNGADSLILEKIQNAEDQDEALRIASEAGFVEKKEKVTKQDSPMTLTDIKNFTEIYGWRPPAGVSQNEALQFMKDNPNATPKELQAAAEEAVLGATPAVEKTVDEVTTFIEENMSDAQLKVFKAKAKEKGFTKGGFLGFGVGKEGVSDYLKSIKSKIEVAISQGFTEQEILDFLSS